MKKSKSILLRALAGLGGFVIVAAVALYVNAQVGNPISNLIRQNRVLDYLSKNYGGMDLYIQDAFYLNGSYTAIIASRSDKDIRFTVACHDEFKNLYDDFSEQVAAGTTVQSRWSTEYTQKMYPILKGKFPNLNVIVSVVPTLDNPPPLESELDPAYVASTSLSLLDTTGKLSPERAADMVTQVYEYCKSKGYVFTDYNLSFVEGVMQGGVGGITPQMIEGGNLLSLLRQAEQDHYAFKDGPYYYPMQDSTKP